MAYIAPNSTIRFHKNVPLDNTYDHTLWFATKNDPTITLTSQYTDQTQYFSASSRIHRTIDNYSYQRHTKDSIKVGLSIETIVNCSYMSFKNTSFEDKWFYAFITNLEYINNNTTIVYYEIDVIQTYLFDINFHECFIERQHTETDEIGEHTVPEPLNVGDYVFTNAIASYNMSGTMLDGMDTRYKTYVIAVATTEVGQYTGASQDPPYDTNAWVSAKVSGAVQGGVYSGLALMFFSFTPNGVLLLNSFLDYISSVANLPDAIVSMFMVPSYFAAMQTINFPAESPAYYNASVANFTTRIEKNTSWTYVKDGVTKSVRNKKLYTAPFNVLYCSNGNGESATYAYEFFGTQDCVFDNRGVIMPTTEVSCIPQNYKNEGFTNNYNEAIKLTNFPQCAYNIDSYKAWLAMNGTKIGFNTALDVIGGAGQIVAGATGSSIDPASAVIGGTTSIVKSIGNALIENRLAMTMPPQAKGSNTNTLNTGLQELGFHFYYCRPKDEFVAIIDDFFTRFGYAISRNKTPNLHARTRYTYIKTIDCTIDGDLPNEYSKKFVDIMNMGITFWADKLEFGNYERSNNVLS